MQNHKKIEHFSKSCTNKQKKIVYHEVYVPKSLISKIFEPFLKSCTSEVHVPRGRVPRGLTVITFLPTFWTISKKKSLITAKSCPPYSNII